MLVLERQRALGQPTNSCSMGSDCLEKTLELSRGCSSTATKNSVETRREQEIVTAKLLWRFMLPPMNTKYLFFSAVVSASAAACTVGSPPADGPSDASSLNSGAMPTPAATNPLPDPDPVVAPTATPTVSNNTEVPPATCGGKTCSADQKCVSYYGIAGPRGPQFHDCVIPCKRGTANDGCPSGKSCRTIADGPGDVCQ